MDNCGCIDAQMKLGTALNKRDLYDFRKALDIGADPTREDDRHITIFEEALKTYGCSDFVKECLRHHCDPNFVNVHLDKAAINFATDSRDPKIVATLLQHKVSQIDRVYGGLTPLNSLAKNITPENSNDVAQCIRLLVEHGASPNKPDQREMTPLQYILKNRKIEEWLQRQLVQLFLALPDLDLDTFRDGEARAILREKYPDMKLPPPTSKFSYSQLLTFLHHDEEKFLENFQEAQNIDINHYPTLSKEEQVDLLMESIKLGAHKAYDAIEKAGVDINAERNGNSPIKIAITWGNWRAMEKLLKREDLNMRQSDHPLITIIGKWNEDPEFYSKCFDHLLDSKHVDVNETDESGSTPLHYAVRYRNREAIQELLKRGAYIGQKSVFNELPIDGIHPNILEEHFNSCITTNGLKSGEQSFKIIIDYKNFIPHQSSTHPESIVSKNARSEMTPISFLANSKEHRYLLQHPLITSFLFLKWHRLSVAFYINFLLYSIFAVSIITHTILKFSESEHETVTVLFGYLSWFGIIYLIIREFIQFAIGPFKYFRSPINYAELALIALSIMTCTEQTYDRETQRIIAVFTILLVALELCLLVGSLPVLSISTHMLMLRAVSTSFLKSFTLYSILVITFSLCFYILFGKPELNKGQTTDSPGSDEGGEFNKFTNPITAIIKTIVMLTGEFDAGDIDFDTLYSYLIFLLFVVFMSIVLFNLLNGLAVSDTQAIKAQAELNGSICRTNLLSRYEKILSGQSGRVSFILRLEPFRTICLPLLNLFPNYLPSCQISISPNDRNRVFVPDANGFEMKDMAVDRSKAIFVQIDNHQEKLLDSPVKFLPCCCSCITGKCSEMDSRTVKLALEIIDRKMDTEKKKQIEKNTEHRLQSIEQKLEQILKRLENQ